MRSTTFTESEEQRLVDACWQALAQGTTPLSELTDDLLALADFEFLRTRLSESGRQVAMNCVGNPLAMDDRFSSGPTFVNASGDDDKLVARIDVALAGRVFTTQVSAADSATGSLSLDTDLIAFDDLLFSADEFTVNAHAGTRTIDPATDRCELRGGPGWLDDFPMGALVAVSWVDGDLQVRIHQGDLEPGDTEAAALLAYAELVPAGHGFYVYEPVVEQITADPSAYATAVAPISELLLAGGFEHRNGTFGPACTTWHDPDIAEDLELRSHVAKKRGFSSCCCDAYDEVLDLWGDHLRAKAESRKPDVDYARAGVLLKHGLVADGVDDCITHRHGSTPEVTGLLVEFLLAVVKSGARATSGAKYLIGKAVERAGEFDNATRLYEMALAADPSYAPPCTSLAWLAFDRGRFGRARHFLTRSGLAPDAPALGFLPPESDRDSRPGRNDCCPCGSGRKFKLCHSGTSLLSAWQRLQLKHDRHASVHKRHRVYMMAFIAYDLDADRADRFHDDAFLADVYLFEGDGLADFVRERGPLLPDDERDLADRLSTSRRLLYDVIRVDDLVWLREITSPDCPKTTTPEPLAVTAPLDRSFGVGDHILARVLPTSDSTATIYGQVLTVSAQQSQSLQKVLRARSGAPPTAERGIDDVEWLGEGLATWYVGESTEASAQ